MDPRRGPPTGPEGRPPDMFYDQIKGIPPTKSNVVWLLFQLSSFVEEEDLEFGKKSAIVFLRNFLIASTIGLTLNVQLKRVYPPILGMSRFATIPIRLLTFGAPFGLFYNSTMTRFDQLDKTLEKYQTRVIKYQRTADIRHLEPPRKDNEGKR